MFNYDAKIHLVLSTFTTVLPVMYKQIKTVIAETTVYLGMAACQELYVYLPINFS